MAKQASLVDVISFESILRNVKLLECHTQVENVNFPHVDDRFYIPYIIFNQYYHGK